VDGGSGRIRIDGSFGQLGTAAGSAGSSPWEVSGWLIGEGLLLILRGAVGLFDGTCDLDS